MKNYIILYRTWSGITGEPIERYTMGWAYNEDDIFEYAAETFGAHCIAGIAEIIETI
jgi:hypothetical protein